MTTTYLFANNATTTLAAPINSSATSLTLASGTGALFPALSAGQAFSITMKDTATGELTEIMYCTARTGDVCTVVRAQEGTTALSWTTGDFVSNALTAGIAELFLQSSSLGTMATQNANAVNITGGTVNATTLEVGGAPVLVNPLTTKGDILVDNGSASVRLPVGSNGQVLTADSTQTDGLKWAAPSSLTNPMTTLGDLIVGGSFGTPSRLAIGSPGQVLTANPSAAFGADWETPSGGTGGGLGAQIAAVAQTLRRAINAYRPEPSADNRALAFTNFNNAKKTNTDGPLTVWEPDGVTFYNAAWTRDQAMCMEAYLEYFTPAEISAIATYTLSKCNLTTGEVPDHIGLDGTVYWTPGSSDSVGSRAPVDGNFFLLQMFWLHYVATGSASLYSAHKTALRGLLEAPGVIYDGTTNCVSISDSSPYVGFGFFDMATLTGSVLFPSILAVRAQQMAAEMEYSLGNTSDATTLLGRATTITAGINANLVAQAAGSGGQLSAPYNAREIAYGLLATIKGVNQVDLWSTAYLVWCDIVSPDVAKMIGNFLYYTTHVDANNYYLGGLRNVLKSTDYAPGSEVYQVSFVSYPYGHYQNGGFWATPAPWLNYAISLVEPVQARVNFGDLYAYTLSLGSNSVSEWWDAAGDIGAQQYLTSTTALLSAGQGGPIQEVDGWFVLDRSVVNETIMLALEVPFSGVITSTSTQCASGSATATFEINSTSLGGTANSISSTAQTQAHATANRFNAGDNISVTFSASSSCVDAKLSIKFYRAA